MSFQPTSAEVALVSAIFAQHDPQKLGVITGDVAVRAFAGAYLPPAVLGLIWDLADDANNGWLARKGVAVAVRLIGWAQAGESIREELIHKPGPLPKIDGIQGPAAAPTTDVSLIRTLSPSNTGVPAVPALTPQDKAKFASLFNRYQPVNGLLPAEQAKDVFLKSKLSSDKLSAIWNLADTKARGALDLADFSVAMALIQASMAGTLTFIPTSLPPGLYEQAAASLSSFASPSSSRVVPQVTGQSPRRAPLNATAWDVTPADKTTADGFFDTLDTSRLGYIEGDVAVPFMLQSGLGEEVLAQIWDLTDLNSDGRLTRDGFAVAMHLINSTLAGKPVPPVLPQTLVPPSIRKAQPKTATSPFTAPVQAFPTRPFKIPFQASPQVSAMTEPVGDLLGDDSPPQSAAVRENQMSILQPQSTGTLNATQNTRNAIQLSNYQPANVILTPKSGDPFASSTSTTFPLNLLDDEDTAPLQDHSAAIGNVKNQLASTNKSLDVLKSDRVQLEELVANQAAELDSMGKQLASAQAAHTTETTLLAALRERQAGQAVDMRQARDALIRAESDLSGVKLEKDEIGGAVLRDKEEVRSLQTRMREVGIALDQEKAAIEALKKEAKQQKGLLAIAKKQVAVREAERKKLAEEREAHEKEILATQTEIKQAEKELEAIKIEHATVMPTTKSPSVDETLTNAVATALPLSPPEPMHNNSHSGKSNNPFDRIRVGSTTPSSTRSQSPFSSYVEVPPAAAIAPVVGSDEDPFGFEELMHEAPTPDPVVTTSVLATEQLSGESPTPTPSTATHSEAFHTPPTSATSPRGFEDETLEPIAAQMSTPRNAPAELSKLSGFPDESSTNELSDAAPASVALLPSHAASHQIDNTDLNAPVKELEMEESDSDSEDDQSLAQVRDKMKASPAVITGLDGKRASIVAFGDTPRPAFISPAAAVPLVPETTTDAFGAPLSKSPPPASTQQHVNGASAFDEAMGTLSSTNSSEHPGLSFDSAFDDNFDFSSASSSSFPPAPSSTSVYRRTSPLMTKQGDTKSSVDSTKSPSLPAVKGLSFDDVFSGETARNPSLAHAPIQTTSTMADVPAPPISPGAIMGISFDDAFGGADTPAQTLSFAGPSTSSRASMTGSTMTASSSAQRQPAPTQPGKVDSLQSQVSQRPATPPSPVRSSKSTAKPTSSSSEKAKESTRSRMSIRLPFGRKKKDKHQLPDDVPPLPVAAQSRLTPLNESPSTPASDDIAAVKQLCGMGFGRTQVVEALEKEGYDVQKALNTLLGQQ